MAEDKPRLVRLTSILTQLQSKRILTAKEIAERHSVSIRTVYRDIKTLIQSGIPIITEEGKGYSIMEGYKLPPIMFTEEEANALITAEHLILKNRDQSLSDQYQNAINKIKSVLRYSQKETVEILSQRIQIRNNEKNDKTSNYLIKIQSYISNYQLIEIDYLSLDNNHSNRLIEPFAIYSTNDNWILIAFCRLRNEFRSFRLDCIKNLTATQYKFEPHKFTLEEYFEECRKKYLNTPDTPLTQPKIRFGSN
ncbi:helix-turn-helix transcriptional regulator [Marinigracilibium pacificum]|uniref:YafY family transcriptional regulator n=1 Tax=Marinigracilibium pacificum TaxID=2729599 RepID=A0A848J3F7_9BACT|nr:YafY family protein [Marinigracilibium pacificum]NMM47712.1 YafY family transcriptional regulator [Marinigracilibium pacificum]